MFLTILAGVSVFVIGQFVLKLILEPIVSFKESLGALSAFCRTVGPGAQSQTSPRGATQPSGVCGSGTVFRKPRGDGSRHGARADVCHVKH